MALSLYFELCTVPGMLLWQPSLTLHVEHEISAAHKLYHKEQPRGCLKNKKVVLIKTSFHVLWQMLATGLLSDTKKSRPKLLLSSGKRIFLLVIWKQE
jgi:hypothetical protein